MVLVSDEIVSCSGMRFNREALVAAIPETSVVRKAGCLSDNVPALYLLGLSVSTLVLVTRTYTGRRRSTRHRNCFRHAAPEPR